MGPKLLAGDELPQFFSKHGTGFITRLDRSSIRSKRVAFLQALVLHTGLSIVLMALAMINAAIIHQEHYPSPVRVAMALTQNAILASAFVILLRSTLIPFFHGECRLRFKYGFRDTEVVIRRLPSTVIEVLRARDGEHDDLVMQSLWRKAARSVDPQLFYSKIGSFFSMNYWTLEYKAVMDAYHCIMAGKFIEEDLDFAVWKYEDGYWRAYQLWKIHDLMTEQQEYCMFKNMAAK